MEPDTKDFPKALVGLIGVVVISVLGLLLWALSPSVQEPTATPTVATINPEVKHEAQVDVAITTPKHTVQAYTAKAKSKLPLPQTVIDSHESAVTSSSLVASSESRQTITSVLDTSTGVTTAYVATAPAPWLALEQRGQVSLDYGFKRNAPDPVLRANLRLDLVQIKKVHLGGSGSVYSDGDYFVGIGGSYRW